MSHSAREMKIDLFKQALTTYIQNRLNGNHNSPGMLTSVYDFFLAKDINSPNKENEARTIFGRFTYKDKKSVVDKIISELDNPNKMITYTSKDIDAADDGDLKKVLDDYLESQPKQFKEEQARQILAMEHRIDTHRKWYR